MRATLHLSAGLAALAAVLILGSGWHSQQQVDNAAAMAASGDVEFRPIAEVQVGQRVIAHNPTGERDDTFGAVDERRWRRVALRAPKADGSWADVVLLRPVSWLAEHGARVGDLIEIAVPECGIRGRAEVQSIGPCPPIQSGEGRLVTGTFHHVSARVVDVFTNDTDEPIGTTANHLFWSDDRKMYVPAGDLRPGERLRGIDSSPRVATVIPRSEAAGVYNLEIEIDHVYHVGARGVLVHNPPVVFCPGGVVSPEDLAKTAPPKAGSAEAASKRRTPTENRQARNKFKNNKEAAREAWEERTGRRWPTDKNGTPWPAEHTPPLKEGGDPMVVTPRDPTTDPHSIPGPDGLTDYQRWGAEGTPTREANKLKVK